MHPPFRICGKSRVVNDTIELRDRLHPDGSRPCRARAFADPATDTAFRVDPDSRAPGNLDGGSGAPFATGKTAATGDTTICQPGGSQPGLCTFGRKTQHPVGAGADTEVAEVTTAAAELHHRTVNTGCPDDDPLGASRAAVITGPALTDLFRDKAGRTNDPLVRGRMLRFPRRQKDLPEGEQPLRQKLLAGEAHFFLFLNCFLTLPRSTLISPWPWH